MQDFHEIPENRGCLRRAIPAILVLAVTFCCITMPVMAHAPSNIAISYNPDMHKLTVLVTHPVDNPEIHYIRGVQVKINGEVISDPTYKNQSGRTVVPYTYDVMANPGDSVWVVATCISGQSLEEHVDIPKPVTPATTVRTLPPETPTLPPDTPALPTPKTTHAAAGLLPLLGAVAVLVILRT